MTTPAQTTNSGIVTDGSGDRHIPESKRADGSTRKAIKIRPGYRPPEDVEVYKNRTAESFRNRGQGPVPGSESVSDAAPAETASSAANKNAKRREARKKAKASGEDGTAAPPGETAKAATDTKAEELDPELEKEKRARNLKKKLKQAKDLQSKREEGESLLPEQIAKVIKINELIRELESLGLDSEGNPKEAGTKNPEKASG